MSILTGFEEGRAELDRLLAKAETDIAAARGQGEQALQEAVLAITQDLVQFTARTEPGNILDDAEVRAIENLDRLADEARRSLMWGTINEIITRIQDRASQLNQLSKQVGQVAKSTTARANQLKFVRVRAAVDAMTSTVDSFKQLRDTLQQDNPEEAAVLERIRGLIEQFEGLRGVLDGPPA